MILRRSADANRWEFFAAQELSTYRFTVSSNKFSGGWKSESQPNANTPSETLSHVIRKLMVQEDAVPGCFRGCCGIGLLA